MDSIEVLKTFVWERLTEDNDLQALCGGTVRIGNNWPEPDEVMPYIVYRFARRYDGPVSQATMTFDFWDENPSGQRITDIVSRVTNLIEWLQYNAGPNGYFRVRKDFELEIQEGGEMAISRRNIRHVSTDWSVRFTRDLEISAITGG